MRSMRIGVPAESKPGDGRVAATPQSVEKLTRELGFEVAIERGAGKDAGFFDAAYEAAGAQLVDGDEAWAAEIVIKLSPPEEFEVPRLTEGATLISFVYPADNKGLMEDLRARRITTLAMDMVPRITRAQKLDALSSLANVAGYRAIIEAAHRYGGFFRPQFTAAGRLPPATVLVIGAGVAGLAAIAAAKDLGAVVRAFDVRPAVKDEVGSLGADFLEIDFGESGDGGGGYAKVMSEEFIAAEMALFRAQAPEVDVVVTTALIPGKPSPVLWMRDMVEAMKPGSIVMDLAAARGGNCELTRPDKDIVHKGVTVVGASELTMSAAATTSVLYANNVGHLLEELGGAEAYALDEDDVLHRQMLVTHKGQFYWPPPKLPASGPAPAKSSDAQPPPVGAPDPDTLASKALPAATAPKEAEPKKTPGWVGWAIMAALTGLWLFLKLGEEGRADPEALGFLQHLTVFILACFVGWQLIWNVTPALHTPLMSVTNAISGIIVLGGMLHMYGDLSSPAMILAIGATLLAAINIAGGFLVTQRMLKMFRKGGSRG